MSKLEDKFRSNNAREVWKGLKQATGFGLKQPTPNSSNDASFADDLNCFYARFDTHDLAEQHLRAQEQLELDSPDCPYVSVTEEMVRRSLSRIKPNKAMGPDGISGRTLRSCKHELSPILTKLFEASVNNHCVPTYLVEDVTDYAHPKEDTAVTTQRLPSSRLNFNYYEVPGEGRIGTVPTIGQATHRPISIRLSSEERGRRRNCDSHTPYIPTPGYISKRSTSADG